MADESSIHPAAAVSGNGAARVDFPKPIWENGGVSEQGESCNNKRPQNSSSGINAGVITPAVKQASTQDQELLFDHNTTSIVGNANLEQLNDLTNTSGEQVNQEAQPSPTNVRKPGASRGSMSIKRRGAAQVLHNLSERRQRRRINEKVRALQQLLPGGKKAEVDKASILEDAVEYVKTLQNQVKMISMVRRLFMPPDPIMLPIGFQHMNVPQLPLFRMGMNDITRCRLIQAPPALEVAFPYARPVPGMTRMFGLPDQGIPMPIPPVPFVPLYGEPSTVSDLLPARGGATAPEPTEDTLISTASNDITQSINSE